MNKVEGGSAKCNGSVRLDGLGQLEADSRQIKSPGPAGVHAPGETRSGSAELPARAFEHVDQRGMRRGFGQRREEQHLEPAFTGRLASKLISQEMSLKPRQKRRLI